MKILMIMRDPANGVHSIEMLFDLLGKGLQALADMYSFSYFDPKSVSMRCS